MRLFFDDMDLWDDMNCSGLLGLRRLISSPCNDPSCSHATPYPAAFEWIFPLVLPDLDVSIPAIGRSFATIIFAAMSYSDTKILEKLMSVVPTVNNINVTKWFSPAHFVASRSNMIRYQNASRLLLKEGIDLHIVPDDEYKLAAEYDIIKGETATSIAMRYSLLFFRFRDLLKSCHIKIEVFVEDELKQKPLREAGWCRDTLLALFELDFEPREMPYIDCQHDEHFCHNATWSFGRDYWWEDVLSTLKARHSNSPEFESLLDKSSRNSANVTNGEGDNMCYPCQVYQRDRPDSLESYEGSPFLFPTSLC